MKKEFNQFRFEGLDYQSYSNKYYTMNRVNNTEDKIVIKVADAHLISTKYGYALILDRKHAIFIKDWAVSRNWFGNEVLLTKEYFNVKEWGEHEDFADDKKNLDWNTWLDVAREQQENENLVKWEK